MKSIDWTKWAAVAEILSAIAIVATLLYLAQQTKYLAQQNEQTGTQIETAAQTLRSEELARLNALERQWQVMRLESEAFRDLYVKTLVSPSELSEEEIWGVLGFLYLRVNILYQVYSSALSGIILESDWEDWLDEAPYYLGTRFGRFMWPRMKESWPNDQRFVELIDKELEKGIQPDDDWFREVLRDFGEYDF